MLDTVVRRVRDAAVETPRSRDRSRPKQAER